MNIIWEIHRYTDSWDCNVYTDYNYDMKQKLILGTLLVKLLLVRTFMKY